MTSLAFPICLKGAEAAVLHDSSLSMISICLFAFQSQSFIVIYEAVWRCLILDKLSHWKCRTVRTETPPKWQQLFQHIITTSGSTAHSYCYFAPSSFERVQETREKTEEQAWMRICGCSSSSSSPSGENRDWHGERCENCGVVTLSHGERETE